MNEPKEFTHITEKILLPLRQLYQETLFCGKSENMGFPSGWVVKNSPVKQEMQVQSVGQKDPLEEEMAMHSSILDWKIPWKKEPGRLQSMGSQRVRHDWSDSAWPRKKKNTGQEKNLTHLTLLVLLSHFSRVRLCATPEMAAQQAPLSLGFSRQGHWIGLPFLSPMHESEKWKWSRSVVSDS